LDNREKVREWVLKRKDSKIMKGFMPGVLIKQLNISVEEAYDHCTELVKENILEIEYHYWCDCEFKGIYEYYGDIPEQCPWCDKEINRLEDTFIGFKFKK
jgi:antitoxin component YwqK of YwqJK toxin-antitoxin module